MLPYTCAAFLLVLAEFGFAQLDQILDLFVVEVLVTDKAVAVVPLLDDAVAPEDATDHVLGDVLVVLDLALVVGEDGSGYLRSRTIAVCSEQRHQHDGLVDIRHPHPVLHKMGESFIAHGDNVPSRASRG
jgi:hypothetical protein